MKKEFRGGWGSAGGTPPPPVTENQGGRVGRLKFAGNLSPLDNTELVKTLLCSENLYTACKS
jgi:hypothetical protein